MTLVGQLHKLLLWAPNTSKIWAADVNVNIALLLSELCLYVFFFIYISRQNEYVNSDTQSNIQSSIVSNNVFGISVDQTPDFQAKLQNKESKYSRVKWKTVFFIWFTCLGKGKEEKENWQVRIELNNH